MSSNYMKDPIEQGIHNAVEECRWNPKHGIVCVVFPELPQWAVEELYDEIEQVLEDHFRTLVFVDV